MSLLVMRAPAHLPSPSCGAGSLSLGGLGSGFFRVLLGWVRRGRRWATGTVVCLRAPCERARCAFLARRMEHVADLDGDGRQRERHPGVPTTHATPTPRPAPPRAHAQYHSHPDGGYDHAHAQYAPQPFPIAHGGTILSAPMAPPPGGPGGGGAGAGVVVRAGGGDEAGRWGARRGCFNCCTIDTSTWRGSNLIPGKVLCKKCGLFERTHSRPRPEQFPHRRGPLASSALRPGSASGSADTPKSPTLPTPRCAVLSPFHQRPIFVLHASGQRYQRRPLLVLRPHFHQRCTTQWLSFGDAQSPAKHAPGPSPKLPGVDSIHPPSRDERREREEERGEERRGRSPE
ncbi:hypothetical protein B0H14DRAFT_3124595 [Mycena olivaceomarginata]|nr:hypothetical protein B0H14DRAFT_3124595 [Mycena olivaceomarginata]